MVGGGQSRMQKQHSCFELQMITSGMPAVRGSVTAYRTRTFQYLNCIRPRGIQAC